ncbi:MAG: hypothetical protein ACREXU_16470, partial [Gammaproteobacteria bacterium]
TSGSGKSSLVRAGLIPALQRGHLPGGGSHWRMAMFRPGDDPLGRLAQALGRPRDLIGQSSFGLVEAARTLDAAEKLPVIVDQFEELFRVRQAGSDPTTPPGSSRPRPARSSSAFRTRTQFPWWPSTPMGVSCTPGR